jgi:AraC-like DNA-binding protein
MGLTPHQYVQQKRLKHAQFLLANGYSASQAASLCGFSSQSAMTTLFSQELGISPVRFQKLYLT